jgi:hypothetical protein
MTVDPTNRIILSTERFKSAPRVDQSLNIPFAQTSKDLVEYDRSVDLSLITVFDEERQASTIFRPVSKFTILFENALSGSTSYPPFRNNLYYTNPIGNAQQYYPSGNANQNGAIPNPPTNQSIPWDGFPQYFEFDFIRTDNDVVGYTQPPNNHVTFKNVSATTYNWSHYISYAYKNIYNKTLFTVEPKTSLTWSWVASQGIPYYIIAGSELSNNFISFRCPVEHGLNAGEFVLLSTNYNGEQMFQVSSLGSTGSGSENYIFNIANVGYTGTTFQTNNQGTFKRVINAANSADTISEYYIRQHRIITNPECTVLTNAGFERNIYGDKKKCEIDVLTPDNRNRVSTKEGNRSYNLSFNCDINIDGLRDNQGRPLSELFFTTLWRGYFGWTKGLKQGWYFNTFLQDKKPQTWWDASNVNSNVNIPQLSYNTPGYGPFYYNNLLQSGDTIDGDFCEWNNYDQLERVISIYQHKIKYNQTFFKLDTKTIADSNEPGYFYQPHSMVQIAQYSDYVEEGSSSNVVGIPDYAYYSTMAALFRWRDRYPYGFIDTDGLGVDYAFLNNAHYPYKNTIFRITPEYFNVPNDYAVDGAVPANITTIADPIADECE